MGKPAHPDFRNGIRLRVDDPEGLPAIRRPLDELLDPGIRIRPPGRLIVASFPDSCRGYINPDRTAEGRESGYRIELIISPRK